MRALRAMPTRLPRRQALAALAVLLAAGASPAAANPSFAPLLGSWGGSGNYRLEDGTSEQLKCDAYYTGSGAQLGIAVRCSGQSNKIEMRSKLSASGKSLSGSWEERTYNAEGAVTGVLSDKSLELKVSGVVSGVMMIDFERNRQTVKITLQGSPLKSVTVNLSRK